MANRPVYLVLAGGNGVGKSTFAVGTGLIASGFSFINPDNIQRHHKVSAQEAGRRILEFIDNRLHAKTGKIAVETTLSGYQPILSLHKAQQLGWSTSLIYLGVESVDIQLGRIAERVRKGGHAIPEDVVRRRYDKSLENLVKAIRASDVAAIFDCSGAGPKALFAAEYGKVTWESETDTAPWAEPILAELKK